MPIDRNELRSPLVVEDTASVRQIVATLLSGEPYRASDIVVVRLGSGGLAAFTLVELNDQAEELGSAVLDATLGELLPDEAQVNTVEWAETKSLRRLQDEARRAPGRRLLVVERDEPLGVVTSGVRRGIVKATVVQLFREQADLDMQKLKSLALRTDFLMLRPQITLNELAWTLQCAEAGAVIVSLGTGAYALLERMHVSQWEGEFGLDRLGRYTLQEIYAARERTGKGYPVRRADTVDASQVRSSPSRDEIVLHKGKPIGYRIATTRKGVLAPESRGESYVNAWFKDHKPSRPLARGKQYELGINVGAQRADSYVLGETYRGPVDQDVYVGLVGDPDVWQIEGPTVQKLHIPASGNSDEIFFQVTPLIQGQQQLVAHFYHRNRLIQTVEITGIQVEIPDTAGEFVFPGQPPFAVTLTRSSVDVAAAAHDANLYIERLPDQDRFRFTFFSASPAEKNGDEPVLHTARVALTTEEMRTMADAARDTVQTHLVGYKEGDALPFHLLSESRDQGPTDAAFQQAVMALARLGYRWFINLFYQTREPKLKAEAERMGDLLLKASASGRLRLQVVSSDFYLPWNMLYTSPTGERKPLTKNTVNVEEGIWGFRHIIEQIPARDLSHVSRSSVIDATERLTISANINKLIDGTWFKPASDQVAFFEHKASEPDLKMELTTRFNEDEVLEALQDEENPEEILYFYCHAVTEGDPKTRFEESRLILTDEAHALKLGDLITETFGLSQLPQAPLVFLNACGSGQMDARFYDSFVQFMRDRGARTVIGTLNDTPIVAGAEFAKRFFERFLQGGPENSAAQLLFELRRELLDTYRNPIGISYALFYSGETYIKRAA